ncbi:hypothetical protein RJ641_026389 [Dillenia turbinata]|uniref:DUF7780 domain-containing protein n=1 Tax=Dillenia turbinata TaxID=194707 RepID=A0AAN8ZPV9_9MAGN
MGMPGKNKSSSDGWGMGFLLVFFPEEHHSNNPKNNNSSIHFKSTSAPTIKRTSSNLLLKAQSTISICALLFFVSLLLFTLCKFESTSPTISSRRLLSQKSNQTPSFVDKFWGQKPTKTSKLAYSQSQFALQGMGTLFLRGNRAMNDVVVAHLNEDTKTDQLRLFLRAFCLSSLSSKSDVVLIFQDERRRLDFDSVIREENDSFLKLVHRESNSNRTSFLGKKEKPGGETLWGRRGPRVNSTESETGVSELTQLSYGSVVGFDSAELDPENSLAGFLDHVPMSLRRWACYSMLLGRLRRNFKHMILIDVKNSLLLGDPLGPFRARSAVSVVLHTLPENNHSSGKHGKKNPERSRPNGPKYISPNVILGGTRGVRRLATAMLTEIVRVAIRHKGKNSVTESSVLSQLAGNEFLLKNTNIDLVMSSELIQTAKSDADLGYD